MIFIFAWMTPLVSCKTLWHPQIFLKMTQFSSKTLTLNCSKTFILFQKYMLSRAIQDNNFILCVILSKRKYTSKSTWAGLPPLLVDSSCLWSSTRNSTWTIIISLIQKWPPKINLNTRRTICRWLPAIQSNQISPRPK